MTHRHYRHCERSEAIQAAAPLLDCFVADAPRNDGRPRAPSLLLWLRQQTGIAACRRGVDRHRLLARKAAQIVRPAGLRAGAGEATAAERLRADHRADDAAVDVDVAVRQAGDDVLDRGV